MFENNNVIILSVKPGKTILLCCLLLVFTADNYLQVITKAYLPVKQEDKYNVIAINDKINPNLADWPSLARLPGIGEKRAKDIINYRNNQKIYDNTSTIYNEYTDLAKVNGIGTITCEQIRDYLIFEG